MFVFNDKYRLRKFDNYNLVIERYNKVIRKTTKLEDYEWQIEGYVSSVSQGLVRIRNLILEDGVELSNNLDDFINYCEQYKIGVEKDDR